MSSHKCRWTDEILEVFRLSVSPFVETEMLPFDEKWRQQHIDKALWRKAGDQGLLCTDLPEEYGCPGADVTNRYFTKNNGAEA